MAFPFPSKTPVATDCDEGTLTGNNPWRANGCAPCIIRTRYNESSTVQCGGALREERERVSNSGKFVLGMFLAVFVTALFAVKPAPAEGVPPALDIAVRVLGLLVGLWIASAWMHPYLSGRFAQRRS
jgi:hypothetical protein